MSVWKSNDNNPLFSLSSYFRFWLHMSSMSFNLNLWFPIAALNLMFLGGGMIEGLNAICELSNCESKSSGCL